MKIYISYFYKIRFFPDNLIPVSTACYDPFWYNNNGEVFYDKRNVINGLRIECLNPSKISKEHVCSKDCDKNYKKCNFLKEYSKYLDSLNFNKVYRKLEKLSNFVKSTRNDNKDIDICLMVYETPSNPCSERQPLIEYFKKNGIEITEFQENK